MVGDHAVDLALVAEHRVELDRFQDRVIVAADGVAVLSQDIELVLDGGDIGVEVARVAVLGDQLEGDLLPRTPDPDRRMRLLHGLRFVDCAAHLVVLTFKRRLVLGPHRLDHLQGFAQHAKALRSVGVLIAIGVVLVVVPARADAQNQPAMTHHVDSARHLGQQRGRAIAVAGDHLAKPDRAGVACQRRDRGPALEDRLQAWLRDRVEVVVEKDRVVARLLRLARAAAHRLVLLDWIRNVGEVHAPTLRHEDPELHLTRPRIGLI